MALRFVKLSCVADPHAVRGTRTAPHAQQFVRFPSPPEEFSSIQFQNYYSASITVSQELQDKPGEWQQLVCRRQLMEDPHFEHDAQDWHMLSKADVRLCGEACSTSLSVTFDGTAGTTILAIQTCWPAI